MGLHCLHMSLKCVSSLNRAGLVYPTTLQGRWDTTDDFTTISFFSSPGCAGKVHPCPLFDNVFPHAHLFFCICHLFFTLESSSIETYRLIFAKPKDLEVWPNHLSFSFLTMVRSSSYSQMVVLIFLRYMVLSYHFISTKHRYTIFYEIQY